MRITVDLAKASTEPVDLTGVLNPRVGDGDLKLPFHIVYDNDDYDMRDKSMDFISEGSDKKQIHVSDTVDESTKGDDPYTGNVTFTFPTGTFKTPGTYDIDKTMFRIINEADHSVISTVNVKLNVLPNDSGATSSDGVSYDSRMEKILQDYSDKGKSALDDANKQAQQIVDDAKKQATDYLNDTKKQADGLLNGIKQTSDEAKSNVAGDTAATAKQAKQQANDNAGKVHDLQGEVGDARGRFMTLSDRENKQDFNIDRKEDKANANANYAAIHKRDDLQDKAIAEKASQKFIMDYLSQMSLKPEGFANEQELMATYPNGKDGIIVTIDTGHGWMYRDGQWHDIGVYQAAADAKALTPVMNQIYRNGQAIAQNSNSANLLQNLVQMIRAELEQDKASIEANHKAIQPIQSAGRLETTYLTDDAGGYLTDSHGEKVAFSTWQINSDRLKEDLTVKPETFTKSYDLPILYLYGSKIPSLVDKTNSLGPDDGISYNFPMFRVSGNLKKIKVQGASSAGLAKKNYTLVFDRKFQAFKSYGVQDKYVIKANMTDASQIRNVSSANLWGAVRGTNVNVNDLLKANDTDYLTDINGNRVVCESNAQLSLGGNYGAITGFPCAVYINNKYWGMYSFCISKDKGMAKMPKGDGYGIVSTVAADFKTPVKLDDTDMSIEYSGTKATGWMAVSINKLIDAVKADYTTKEDFVKAVSPYLDLGSAIDYYVYTVATGNCDGIYRNFCLQTWNGQTWFVAAYDLDLTFGRSPDLSEYLSPVYKGKDTRKGGITFENLAGTTRLFEQLWKFHKNEIIARYNKLVNGPLSPATVGTLFTNYARHIPKTLKDEEANIWPETPNTDVDNIDQIRWWYKEHTEFLKDRLSDATAQTVNN